MFEIVLQQALTKLNEAQDEGLLEKFALIGAFAVARWATPRATGDIEFVIAASPSTLKELAAFCSGQLRRGDVRDPLLATISFELKDENGPVPIQLIILPPAWEEIAFSQVVREDLGGFIVPIVDWQALVLLKLYAGSALDLQDARSILLSVKPVKASLKTLKQRAKSLRVDRRLAKVMESLTC